MADFLTFAELYAAIGRAIKDYNSAWEILTKEVANQVYYEMMVSDDLYPLHWMRRHSDSLVAIAPTTTITAVTAATPCKITVANSLVDDYIVSIHDVVGMTELNDRFFRVDDRLAASITLADLDGTDVNSSAYTAWTSGGVIHHRGMVLSETLNIKQILDPVYWPDEGRMTPLPDDEEGEGGRMSLTNSTTARPVHYQLYKTFTAAGVELNILLWYPGADQAYSPLRYWYELGAAKLAADADVPMMPPQFHYGIIAGAVARLAENNVQVENAVIWPGLYTMALDDFRTYNRKFYKEIEKNKREQTYLL